MLSRASSVCLRWLPALLSCVVAQAADGDDRRTAERGPADTVETAASASKDDTRTPAPAAAALPQWQLALDTLADGTRAVTATLPALEPIRSGFGETTPKLVLRYRAGRTVAYVLFDTFLGTGTVDVEARFGDGADDVVPWRVSGDGRAVIVPGDALAFIERLKSASKVSVRARRKKGEPLDASFAPTEMELVMKALISAGVTYTR